MSLGGMTSMAFGTAATATETLSRGADAGSETIASVAYDSVTDTLGVEWLQQILDSIGGHTGGLYAAQHLPAAAQELLAAFAGGTVGVLITLVALESWRQRAAEQQLCPYCRGSGRLPCGNCFGLACLPDASSPLGEAACESCSGTGAPQCNHCEGSGRLLPIRYERALRRRQDQYYFGSFDEDVYRVDRSNNSPPY